MTSKERIFAAFNGLPSDHVPLTTWCFGFGAPPELQWQRNGRPVEYWYSLRMEHIHTLPQAWTIEDDFARVQAWERWGVDDILDVSVPWSLNPTVIWEDRTEHKGESYPILAREYSTPAGPIVHSVRKTGEEIADGWVVQPEFVPLIEDFNIPRGVKHLVGTPRDIEKLKYLYAAPDNRVRQWFAERMEQIQAFAEDTGTVVQAWSAFGMDAVVWFTGVENAVLLAIDHPTDFHDLIDLIDSTDAARTQLAAEHPGVDLVVQRGWYSSTDFWSPSLFDEFLGGGIRRNAEITHRAGKKFAYVMTTGVEILGSRLADAGVDVLYFVDPVQDHIDLDTIRNAVGSEITLVGGTNSLSLVPENQNRIDNEVHKAIETLGKSGRFILHPADAIFPDTPVDGVKRLIEAWMKYR